MQGLQGLWLQIVIVVGRRSRVGIKAMDGRESERTAGATVGLGQPTGIRHAIYLCLMCRLSRTRGTRQVWRRMHRQKRCASDEIRARRETGRSGELKGQAYGGPVRDL